MARHGFLDEIKCYHVIRVPTRTYQSALVIAKRLGSVARENCG